MIEATTGSSHLALEPCLLPMEEKASYIIHGVITECSTGHTTAILGQLLWDDETRISSVQSRRSVVSDSLRPPGL